MVLITICRGLRKFTSLVRSNRWVRALLIAGLCFASGIYVGRHISAKRALNPGKHGVEEEQRYEWLSGQDLDTLLRERDNRLEEAEQTAHDRLRDSDDLRRLFRYHLDRAASPTVEQGDTHGEHME